VTQSSEHLSDELLSAFVDDQLTPAEAAAVQAHARTCPECLERADGMRAVALLLGSLPDVEPPRDFKLGPRLLADPPNVVRLRRWYAATRVAAAALAAIFVVLSAGTLYVDSRSRPAPTAALVESAPAAQSQSAPAAAPRAPAAGAAAAVRSAPAAKPQADDQVAAATSVKPLPTPVSTAIAPLSVPVAPPDTAAPLRVAAALVGLLAVFVLLATFVVRHRLLRQISHQ
jgi:hypothetical protein